MRTSDTDTIVAVATAPGQGAIGVVRLSGPEAVGIGDRCFKGKVGLFEALPRTLIFGRFVRDGQYLDEVLATVMYGPNSYTGENSVEFNCHGGPYLLRCVVETLVLSGARLAEAGEFTKRAYLNGKLDLTQAQAVADMIAAPGDFSLKSAYFQLRGGLSTRFSEMAENLRHVAMLLEAGLDFSEDVTIDLSQVRDSLVGSLMQTEKLVSSYRRGKIIREGAVIALIGKPNVGKSSLMNRLLEEDRAIVSAVPGTTRDTIEEKINLDGIAATLVDTAGIRETSDLVEREGARRSTMVSERADFMLIIADGSRKPTKDDQVLVKRLGTIEGFLVLNKSDLGIHPGWPGVLPSRQVRVSALRGDGIGHLRRLIRISLLGSGQPSMEVITQERQLIALEAAKAALEGALNSLDLGQPGEILALDVRIALDALSDIVGETTPDDVLESIFRTFCIGK